MIWQIPLILMGIISPPQPLASACITHPLHLGVGIRGPTCCLIIINIIVCLSLQAPPVYWKLHPGLCAPVLLQHTHNNKCNIATDYKVQKRGSVRQANFRLKFGIFFINSGISQLQGQFSLSTYHLNWLFGQMELRFFIEPYHLIRFVDLLTEGDEN